MSSEGPDYVYRRGNARKQQNHQTCWYPRIYPVIECPILKGKVPLTIDPHNDKPPPTQEKINAPRSPPPIYCVGAPLHTLSVLRLAASCTIGNMLPPLSESPSSPPGRVPRESQSV